MWGFIIAIECALALLLIWGFRRARRGRWGGMYRFFSRLETTPGQEQVIRTAMAEFRDAGRKVRHDVHHSAPDLSLLLEAEEFDEVAAKSWLASRERTLAELKPTFLKSLRAVHDVLDPEQRKRLVQMLSRPHYHGWGCGHRHAAGRY